MSAGDLGAIADVLTGSRHADQGAALEEFWPLARAVVDNGWPAGFGLDDTVDDIAITLSRRTGWSVSEADVRAKFPGEADRRDGSRSRRHVLTSLNDPMDLQMNSSPLTPISTNYQRSSRTSRQR